MYEYTFFFLFRPTIFLTPDQSVKFVAEGWKWKKQKENLLKNRIFENTPLQVYKVLMNNSKLVVLTILVVLVLIVSANIWRSTVYL